MLDYRNTDMDVQADIGSFDKKSGSWFEGILFNNRIVFLLLCFAVTLFLGFKALDVRVNADFMRSRMAVPRVVPKSRCGTRAETSSPIMMKHSMPWRKKCGTERLWRLKAWGDSTSSPMRAARLS